MIALLHGEGAHHSEDGCGVGEAPEPEFTAQSAEVFRFHHRHPFRDTTSAGP